MKAFILNETGGIDKLKLKDVDTPDPKDEEVLVRVKAISINPVDVKSRAYEGVYRWIYGTTQPVIPGWDISGVVEKTGSNASAFKVGDEVFGMVKFPGIGSAYAEYVAVPESQLAMKPKDVSFEEAAGAALAALTAFQTLAPLTISHKTKMLVHGASGGVGHFVVQMTRSFGGRVIGTSSPTARDFVLGLGAEKHIDYQAQKFETAGNDFDIIFDNVQGETLTRSLPLVKKGGTIITIPSGNIPEADRKRAEELGINIVFKLVQSSGSDMQKIADMIASGKLKTHIHDVFAFDKLPQAHLTLEKGGVKGKVIVKVS